MSDDFLGAAIRSAIPNEDGEDDGPAFEHLAAEPLPGGGPILRALRQARIDVLNDQITLMQYGQAITAIADQVEQFLSLLEAPAVKAQRKLSTSEEIEIHDCSIIETRKLLEGIDGMLDYVQSRKKGDLIASGAIVEEAMLALTQLEQRTRRALRVRRAPRSSSSSLARTSTSLPE